MSDVVCGHFGPDAIMLEANAEALPENDMPYLVPALMLLKGPDALRTYRVDVETDSTVAPDEAGERQAATELLTGISSFLGAAMPMLGGVAQAAPHALQPMTEMVSGLLTMAVRRFRGGEEAEELIEKAMQALGQPAPPMQQMGASLPVMPVQGGIPGEAAGQVAGVAGAPVAPADPMMAGLAPEMMQ